MRIQQLPVDHHLYVAQKEVHSALISMLHQSMIQAEAHSDLAVLGGLPSGSLLQKGRASQHHYLVYTGNCHLQVVNFDNSYAVSTLIVDVCLLRPPRCWWDVHV